MHRAQASRIAAALLAPRCSVVKCAFRHIVRFPVMPLTPRLPWSSNRGSHVPLEGYASQDQPPVERGNRRRLRVFLAVFLLVLVAGEVWNFVRPAEYRAVGRLQLTFGTAPATGVPLASSTSPLAAVQEMLPGNPAALLDEVQRLSSLAILEKVLARLKTEGRMGGSGDTTPDSLRDMMGVVPVPGANVIQIQATGTQPERLAWVVNTLIEVYRDDLAQGYARKGDEERGRAQAEMTVLEQRIARKQGELDAYRSRHGVFSSERDENEGLARIKGLNQSLNGTNEKLAAAEARLAALKAAKESGRGQVQPKDNPTLASLEQRASQAREQLRDMERTYTRDFMTMDPQAKALRARLAELEKQMVEVRASSQHSALEEAETEVESLRATVQRLRQQLSREQEQSRGFVQDFSKAKELENDLSQLESLRRASLAHLARVESGGASVRPTLGVVDVASVTRAPWRPDYLRDGLIVLGAAFLAGLLAMWFVELFHRVAVAAPATTIVLPSTTLVAPNLAPELPGVLVPAQLGAVEPPPALPGVVLPRELSQQEVASLLAAANPAGRIVCACLLLGLGVDECGDLSQADVGALEGEMTLLRAPGAAGRQLPIPGWLARALRRQDGMAEGQSQRMDAEEISALVCAAAHDAGLDEAESVTPAVLRHTGIAWLVRQGMRFSDLAGRAGRISAEELAAYGRLAPEVPRNPSGAPVPLMPALAQWRGEAESGFSRPS